MAVFAHLFSVDPSDVHRFYEVGLSVQLRNGVRTAHVVYSGNLREQRAPPYLGLFVLALKNELPLLRNSCQYAPGNQQPRQRSDVLGHRESPLAVKEHPLSLYNMYNYCKESSKSARTALMAMVFSAAIMASARTTLLCMSAT